MPHQMIPSVEKRMSAWIDIQRKRKEQEMAGEKPRTTITISRQFGCEGYPLVAALQSRLEQKTGQEWTIFDNKFVDKLLADEDKSYHLPESFGDRAKYLDYLISTLMPTWKSDTEAFRPMVEAIHRIAQHGNAIILERGAFAITRNLPNCFHFRLIAPMSYRVDSYSKRAGLSSKEAEEEVAEKEKDRTRFLSDFLNCSFDQESFHIIYNNAKLPIERIADSIVHFIDID